MENFDFDRPNLKLNRSQVFDLATCRFVEEKVNCLVVGPTGVGKSHLAQAIGHQACRQGFDVLTMPFSRVLSQLRVGRADGTYVGRS